MNELMDKLQSVLNDEESMKQVRELADMLSGGETGSASPASDAQSSSVPPIDPMLLMKIQGIMSQASKPDKNIDLLMALRPLLKDENKQKLDRIVKLFRLVSLYPAIKESGILGGDLLGIL